MCLQGSAELAHAAQRSSGAGSNAVTTADGLPRSLLACKTTLNALSTLAANNAGLAACGSTSKQSQKNVQAAVALINSQCLLPSICSGAIAPFAQSNPLSAFSATRAAATALAIVQSACRSIGHAFGPGGKYCYDTKGSTLRNGELLRSLYTPIPAGASPAKSTCFLTSRSPWAGGPRQWCRVSDVLLAAADALLSMLWPVLLA